MKKLFDQISYKSSRLVTNTYSTSFSLAIRFLHKDFRNPIHSVYGFVRFADEIVDSFEGYPKGDLLERFRHETYAAIEDKISLNPILNSFQATVHQYGIEKEQIETFLKSMEMDLCRSDYDQAAFEAYILGSAEMVGLMCLKIFCENDDAVYNSLKWHAMKLGSAFQKINFLRDMKADYFQLGRQYFPNIEVNGFNDEIKKRIEADILSDFEDGFAGIVQLPKKARFGVYMAYIYYKALFKKISKTSSTEILTQRIRISSRKKIALIFSSYVRHSFNLL